MPFTSTLKTLWKHQITTFFSSPPEDMSASVTGTSNELLFISRDLYGLIYEKVVLDGDSISIFLVQLEEEKVNVSNWNVKREGDRALRKAMSFARFRKVDGQENHSVQPRLPGLSLLLAELNFSVIVCYNVNKLFLTIGTILSWNSTPNFSELGTF